MKKCHVEMKKKTLFVLLLILLGGCMTPPQGKGPSSAGVFYPPLPQRPRLQFLQSISGQHDLEKHRNAIMEFLVGRPQDQLLGKPYDVGTSAGKIYVLDREKKNIVILDLKAGKLSFVNDSGSGGLVDPAGIWVSADDVKYVADMKRKQVVVFDRNDHFLRVYGTPQQFEKPVDVAADAQRVFVVDMNKEQLIILDKDSGRTIRTVGEKGDFFKPSHVTVAPSGDLFITDAFHFVVKKLTADGDFIATIGFHGDQIGGFVRPKGTAVDRDDRLYVVDAAFENVQIFDDQGRILLYFGGPGSDPGSLYLPAGIAIDYDNVAYFQKFADPDFKLDYLVHVTNMFGRNRLNVYGFGHWVGEGLPGK
jgi:DNA-binding beta-propeller fold protein YncE